MTKQEAIEAIKAGKKVKHKTFGEGEYLYLHKEEIPQPEPQEGEEPAEPQYIETVKHEDDSIVGEMFWRMRQTEEFETGWTQYRANKKQANDSAEKL